MNAGPPTKPPGRETLPPLVLGCRRGWRFGLGSASVLLLGLGAAVLADRGRWAGGAPAPAWVGVPLLLLGAACAYFTVRYCLSRLVLDDRGFRLVGPLGGRDVPWSAVIQWDRRAPRGGPATLRVVHEPGRRHLLIPLIYEDCHALEIGLGQRGFPKY